MEVKNNLNEAEACEFLRVNIEQNMVSVLEKISTFSKGSEVDEYLTFLKVIHIKVKLQILQLAMGIKSISYNKTGYTDYDLYRDLLIEFESGEWKNYQ